MASFRASSSRILPFVFGAAAVGAVGTVYYTSRRPLLLDAAQNAPLKTLSFPSSMLFAKQLTVTKVEQVNHDTKKITFALPGGDNEISGVPPGSAILTQHQPANGWFPVLRPYTPIQAPDARGELQLLVKQYPHGRASTYLHSLAPGQKLSVRGPTPGYAWTAATAAAPRDLLLVAGGAGITPLYSLAHGLLAAPGNHTRIHLLWGVNGTRDIVLRDELAALAARFPGRLRVTYVVSGPEGRPDAPSLGSGGGGGGDAAEFRKGYIDRALLQDAIARCEQAGSFGDDKGTKVFLCGPPKMEEAIAGKKGVLAELGIDKKKVHRF